MLKLVNSIEFDGINLSKFYFKEFIMRLTPKSPPNRPRGNLTHWEKLKNTQHETPLKKSDVSITVVTKESLEEAKSNNENWVKFGPLSYDTPPPKQPPEE